MFAPGMTSLYSNLLPKLSGIEAKAVSGYPSNHRVMDRKVRVAAPTSYDFAAG
jgi:hypothetical protein